MNKIAVIIASYERPRLLRQTIESLQQNSDNKPYIVVIDDFSPSLEVHEYLTSLGDTIKYIRMMDRISIANVKNMGYANIIPSEYVLFTDNDVYFEPHWDTKMISVMEAKPEIGILGGYHHPHHQIDSGEKVGDVDILYSNTQAGVSIFVRDKDYELIGPWFSAQMIGGEDANFCEQALTAGFKIAAVTPACILHCGVTGSSGHQVADATQILGMQKEGVLVE